MITKRFNFIHVPRTGGSTIQQIIKQSNLQVVDSANHKPLMETLNIANLPTFTVVRNPFDWYVSWYEWLCQTDRFEGSFHDYMRKVEKDLANPMFKIVPYSLFGTFSACWNYFVGPRPMHGFVHIVRFEHLAAQLPSMLNTLSGGKMNTEKVRESLSKTRLRSTQRENFLGYYDQELDAIVQRRDRYMLDTFQYKGGY